MTIFVKGLTFSTIIGVLPHERTTPQRVIFEGHFTCKEETPLSIDYAKVVALVKKVVTEGEFFTVEEALFSLEEHIKTSFSSIGALMLSLSKPDILPECTVGACLEKKY